MAEQHSSEARLTRCAISRKGKRSIALTSDMVGLISIHETIESPLMCGTITVSDSKVPKTVAMLKDKKFSKKSIIGGECATPGIISLIAASSDQKIKKLLNLNEKSNVLLIGCEGNADMKLYRELLIKGRK